MSKKSNKTKKTKKKAWITVLVIFLALALFMGGAVTGWYAKDKGLFDKSDKEQTAELPQDENKPAMSPDVQDGDGNALVSGTVYPMPKAMIMAATTAESVDSGEGVTIEATVTPENAIDKRVDYTFQFKDPNSTWARDKDVTDHLTVTPESDGSTRAVVKCLAPFGEQIIITVTTRGKDENGESKTATCTVDFLQKVTNVQLKIGNIDVNLGGDTNVTIDAASDKYGDGGVVSLTYDKISVFTIADDFSATVHFTRDPADGFTSSEGYYTRKYVYMGGGYVWEPTITYDAIEDETAVGRSIYFDRRLFSDFNFATRKRLTDLDDNLWSNISAEEIKQRFDEQEYDGLQRNMVKDKVLWTVEVTFVGEHAMYTYISELVWSEIIATLPVGDVEVDPPNMVV